MAFFASEEAQEFLKKHKLEIDPSSPNGKLTCTICRKLIPDVYESFCGCTFCRDCIYGYVSKGNKFCPGENTDCKTNALKIDINVYRSAKLNARISKVKVLCPNKLCGHIDDLENMVQHFNECPENPLNCPFNELGCGNGEMSKEMIKRHMNTDNLVHGQLLMKSINEMKNAFLESQAEIRSLHAKLALNDRQSEIQKKEIERINKVMKEAETNRNKHQSDVTSLKKNLEVVNVVISEFNEGKHNKEVTMTRQNSMEIDLNNEIKEEINILKNELEVLRKSMTNNEQDKIKEISNEIESLKRQSENQKKETEKIDKGMKEAETQIKKHQSDVGSLQLNLEVVNNKVEALRKSMKSNELDKIKEMSVEMESQKNTKNDRGGDITRLTTTVDDVMREMKESTQEKENRIVSLEKELSKVRQNGDKVMNDVRKMMDENDRVRKTNNWIRCNKLITNDNASVIWRIEGCSKKIDVPIMSESFYSYNYKLSLYVKILRNDDIWLLCFINSGENDVDLEWPMKKKVTLSIIDQYTLKTHETQTYQYDSYERNKKAFDRPTKDSNIGIGSSSFIKYSSIKGLASVVVDDSIIVSCVISNP